MELNRATIKAQARELIKGNVFVLFLILFVVELLTGNVSTLFTNFGNAAQQIQNGNFENFSPDAAVAVSGGNFTFGFGGIIAIVLAPLAVSVAAMMLQYIKGKRYTLGEEFSFVFKNAFDGNFVQKLLLELLVGIFTGLWCLLFIIPGIVYHYKTYFVDYIMADNPNLDWRETIALSKKMTNGHKGELFVLDWSFILWDLLTIITCGIAGIYVMPYVEVTKALYYENFKARGIALGELSEYDFLSESEKMAQAYQAANGAAPQGSYVPPQPVQPQYQPPVQPQYQPPQPVAPVAPVVPAEPVEPVIPEEPAAPAEEAPQTSEEAYYTPPADAAQYFKPLDSDDSDDSNDANGGDGDE